MWWLGLLTGVVLAEVFEEYNYYMRDSSRRSQYCSHMLAGSSAAETNLCRQLCHEHNVGDCPEFKFPLRHLHEVIMCVKLVGPFCNDVVRFFMVFEMMCGGCKFAQGFDEPNMIDPREYEDISSFCRDEVAGGIDGDAVICQYVCRRLLWTGAVVCDAGDEERVTLETFKGCFLSLMTGLCRTAISSAG